MLFNSLAFLIFLPIVLAVYWLTPSKYRWIPLLIASYYFYMSWNVNLVFLIMATTLLSYFSGIVIEKYDKKAIKLTAMLISVISSLVILFFFKYFNFLSDSVVKFFRMCGLPMGEFTLKVMLPVGISFYTFQTLSYSIDVYRGSIKAERHFGYYALFVSYFPQLVAGPIERPENLLPQLRKETKPNAENMAIGMQYILVGFFKKVVVADTLAIYVNAVFNNVGAANGFTIMLATLLFTIQILCDFDGYTNIAIGVAKMMNIDLMKNFNNPYMALSIKDFWSRWHISLSSWFRDYVYIPMGGNRCKKPRHLFNLFFTFFLSGIWHGANWTFVLWGSLHGLYQVVGNVSEKPKQKLYAKMGIDEKSGIMVFLKRATTFCLVSFAWIFFRANSISDLGIIFKKLFTDWSFNLSFVGESCAAIGMTPFIFLLIVAMIALLTLLSKVFVDKRPTLYLLQESVSVSVVRKVIYTMLTCVVILGWIFVASQSGYQNAFIYFQF